MNKDDIVTWWFNFKQKHESKFKILGICSHCLKLFKYPKPRRQNTAYVDDSLNWIIECDECFEETERYWNDMWDEYNSGRF